jgi:hypothetical protein
MFWKLIPSTNSFTCHCPYKPALNFRLSLELQSVAISQDNYQWTYTWGSGPFSSSKAYKVLTGTFQFIPCLVELEILLAGLLLKDLHAQHPRVIKKKNMKLQSFDCILCDDHPSSSATLPQLAGNH